jgi:hypothetical protein
MRRRKLLVVLAGMAVVGAVGTVVLWPQPPSRITRENFVRVCAGMSRAEIEAILGPSGDYRTGPTRYYIDGPWEGIDRDLPHDAFWWFDDGTLDVEFGRGAVRARWFFPAYRLDQGPFDWFLWRAKRQWHRRFPE